MLVARHALSIFGMTCGVDHDGTPYQTSDCQTSKLTGTFRGARAMTLDRATILDQLAHAHKR